MMKRMAAVVTCLLAGAVSAQNLNAGAQVGLRAPVFNARPVNAAAVSSARLAKPSGCIVAFADPRNQLGSDTIAYMQQTYPRIRATGAGAVVFVIGGSQDETVRQMVKDNNLTVPVANDAGSAVAKQYGVTGSATTFVIAPNGLVYGRWDATEQIRDIGPKATEALGKLQTELEDARKAAEAGQPAPTPGKGTAAAGGKVPPKGPSDDELHRRIESGWKLIQAGYVAAALEDARSLAAQRVDDWQATLWLAYCLEAARMYPEAAVTYRKVLLLKPGHVYSLKAIARIDPDGRWRTPADLPQPAPAPSSKEQGGNGGATTSQGSATVGQ